MTERERRARQNPSFACPHSPSLTRTMVENCDSRGSGDPCPSRGHYVVTGRNRKIRHPNPHPQGRIQSRMLVSVRMDEKSPPGWEMMGNYLWLHVVRHRGHEGELTRSRSSRAREEEGMD